MITDRIGLKFYELKNIFRSLLIITLILNLSGSVSADGVMKISPPITNVSVNDTFNVSVNISSGEDMQGGTFDLWFNNSILNATSVVKGSFMTCATIGDQLKINNSVGKVHVAVFCSGGGTVTGEGPLATITFKAISGGSSNLGLKNAYITDANADPMTTAVQNGSVHVNTPCTCGSCSECMQELNSYCAVVNLTQNIINYSETCINNPEKFSNKTFDCRNHTIDGTLTGYGIYLNGKSGNTIRNCMITNFDRGIRLYSSSNNIIDNNTAHSNSDPGIYLENSINNNIINNVIYSNNNSGIYLGWSSNNTLINNTAHSNNNSGILIYMYSNYNAIINNTANSNNYGIYLYSDFNSIKNNSIKNNTNTGIYFSSDSSDNNLISNLICENGLDVNDADSNSGYDNTCNTTYNWNDTDAKGCTHLCTLHPAVKANITAYQTTACDAYSIPQTPIYENTTATFNASNSNGTIISYLWDFGDGSQTTGIIVNHSYAACGNYTVNLTVTGNNGLNDSITITMEVNIPGDINSDGKVNFWDLVDFAASWGKSCSDGDYIPKADINGDGTVDFWDLADFAANWGRSC